MRKLISLFCLFFLFVLNVCFTGKSTTFLHGQIFFYRTCYFYFAFQIKFEFIINFVCFILTQNVIWTSFQRWNDVVCLPGYKIFFPYYIISHYVHWNFFYHSFRTSLDLFLLHKYNFAFSSFEILFIRKKHINILFLFACIDYSSIACLQSDKLLKILISIINIDIIIFILSRKPKMSFCKFIFFLFYIPLKEFFQRFFTNKFP